VQAVEAWLTGIGVGTDMLACGTHRPFDQKSAQDLLAKGMRFTALHHNCSGKHAGFLSTAHHLGLPLAGYVERSHPVQRMVTAALSEMTACDLANAPRGIDGCSIPAYALPLRNLALAMAKFSRPDLLDQPRRDAARRITQAMLAQPWFVGGTGRFDTMMMTSNPSRFVVKMGAEGVHAAILPASGLGIALKIDDGARRGAELAMRGLLQFVGAREQAGSCVGDPILSHRGEPVGQARAVSLSGAAIGGITQLR
jgi:L-asparaginase II